MCLFSNLLLTPLSFGMKHFIWENLAPSAEILSHLSKFFVSFFKVHSTLDRCEFEFEQDLPSLYRVAR